MHERWQQAQRLFHEIVDLPPEQRRERLATACSDDENLQAEVESLVACEQGRPDCRYSELGRQNNDIQALGE